jgi:hypothetical protein
MVALALVDRQWILERWRDPRRKRPESPRNRLRTFDPDEAITAPIGDSPGTLWPRSRTKSPQKQSPDWRDDHAGEEVTVDSDRSPGRTLACRRSGAVPSTHDSRHDTRCRERTACHLPSHGAGAAVLDRGANVG